MINRDLKKSKNKVFFFMSFYSALQTYERDCIRFDKREKFTCKALAVAVTKKRQFSITYIYIAGQISRLFHEFNTLYEPTVNGDEEGEAVGIETCAVDASSSEACDNNIRCVGRLECSCCCVTVSCANVGVVGNGTGHLNLQIFAFT